jgi:3-hydroxyacyl-CoA dehydrogenase
VTDENCAKTVTIIGAGIGGLYLIAELGVAGFKLRLHDIDDSKLSEIRGRGGVDVEGEKGGFARSNAQRRISNLRPTAPMSSSL